MVPPLRRQSSLGAGLLLQPLTNLRSHPGRPPRGPRSPPSRSILRAGDQGARDGITHASRRRRPLPPRMLGSRQLLIQVGFMILLADVPGPG